MKIKKILMPGLFVFFCAAFLTAQTDDNIPISVQRLSERVLILSETLMSNNVVAIAAEKGLVVVDTSGLPSTAAEIRRIIEKEFGRTDFAYVINTHSNWDHTFGNQVFPDAVIVGHENVISGMARDKDIIPRRIASLEERLRKETDRLSNVPVGSEEAKNIQDFLRDLERQIHDFKNVFVSTPPQITFDDRMVLDLGDITVKLDYFGRAHSTSDIFIHVPEEGILITGDVFLDQRWVPLFAGQPELDIDRWIEVLHRALDGEDAPSRVIPAHMDIWEAEKLVLWRDYIANLWNGLKKAKVEGFNLEQARERFPLPEPYYYLRERGHSDERILTFHANNIEAFWSQLFISAADIIEEILTERGLEGLEEAERKFQELKIEPDKYLISEREFNSLGYRLLQQNKLPHAVAVFRMNVESFPQSGNVYDSLAEAYLFLGDKDKTIQYYKKSLEHDPQNENARSRLERMDELFEEYHPTTSEDALFGAGEQTGLKGPYLGQKPPGRTPEIFAAGIVSTELNEHGSPTFSPDLTELYWSPQYKEIRGGRIIFMKIIDSHWQAPKTAAFSQDFKNQNPFLSFDGKRLFFKSFRPIDADVYRNGAFWVSERTPEGWSIPKPLGCNVNSGLMGQQISESMNRNLYFASERPSGKGLWDIYRVKYASGKYTDPENLGDSVNTEFYDGSPYISPNEKYLIFSSLSRPDGQGGSDLYMSYRDENGDWTKAINMGPVINTKEHEGYPIVSPDGKYLFFVRNGDVYWVDAQILEELKPGKDWPAFLGPLLGQNVPEGNAEVFMDGIISTLNEDEMCAAFAPDGREFYFNARHGGNWTIFMTKETAGEWVRPAPMPFTSDYTDRDFTLSPDGKKIFFGSNRPRSKGSGPLESLDIFVTERRAPGRWSDPENIGDPINTDRSENYPSCARNGNLYFFTSRDDGFGGCDIYVSRWENGRYSLPENLGSEVNSDKHDWDAFIAPDESFILFSSQNRADSIGQQDLYISYKNEDGGWTAAKNMGPSVNSPDDEICPSLSADGKCLFFTSRRRGRADIYWIDARIIEELRPKK